MNEWIKFEKATFDKPEIVEIAAILGIDPDAAVGKCLRVWAWFDTHTVDGVAPVTVRALLDRHAGVTSFSLAMTQVGWLPERDGELRISQFHLHNGKSAKNRAQTRARVRKIRESNTDVTPAPLQKESTIEEEREVEVSLSHNAGARAHEGGPETETLVEEGRAGPPIPAPGFPTKEAVVAYCQTQGWPADEGAKFFCHYDAARSNGDRIIGPNWHWWSSLEKWMRNAPSWGGGQTRSGGPPRSAGGGTAKATINEYDRADDWTPDQMTLTP